MHDCRRRHSDVLTFLSPSLNGLLRHMSHMNNDNTLHLPSPRVRRVPLKSRSSFLFDHLTLSPSASPVSTAYQAPLHQPACSYQSLHRSSRLYQQLSLQRCGNARLTATHATVHSSSSTAASTRATASTGGMASRNSPGRTCESLGLAILRLTT